MIFVPFGSSPPPIASSPSQPAPTWSALSPRVNTLQPEPRGRLQNFPFRQTIRRLSLSLPIALWSPTAASLGQGARRASGAPLLRGVPPQFPLPAPHPRPRSPDLTPKPSPPEAVCHPRMFLCPGRDEQSVCKRGGHAVGFGATPHAGAPSRGSPSGVRGICPAGRKRGKRFCEAGATPVASYASRPAPEGCGRAHVGVRRLWGGGGSRAGRRGPTERRAVKEGSRRREQPDVPLAAGPPGPPP